jgi:hypothetical protein
MLHWVANPTRHPERSPVPSRVVTTSIGEFIELTRVSNVLTGPSYPRLGALTR